jgi:hypothetical protein
VIGQRRQSLASSKHHVQHPTTFSQQLKSNRPKTSSTTNLYLSRRLHQLLRRVQVVDLLLVYPLEALLPASDLRTFVVGLADDLSEDPVPPGGRLQAALAQVQLEREVHQEPGEERQVDRDRQQIPAIPVDQGTERLRDHPETGVDDGAPFGTAPAQICQKDENAVLGKLRRVGRGKHLCQSVGEEISPVALRPAGLIQEDGGEKLQTRRLRHAQPLEELAAGGRVDVDGGVDRQEHLQETFGDGSQFVGRGAREVPRGPLRDRRPVDARFESVHHVPNRIQLSLVSYGLLVSPEDLGVLRIVGIEHFVPHDVHVSGQMGGVLHVGDQERPQQLLQLGTGQAVPAADVLEQLGQYGELLLQIGASQTRRALRQFGWDFLGEDHHVSVEIPGGDPTPGSRHSVTSHRRDLNREP